MNRYQEAVNNYLDSLPFEHRRLCPATGGNCWCMGCARSVDGQPITDSEMEAYYKSRDLEYHKPRTTEITEEEVAAIWRASK